MDPDVTQPMTEQMGEGLAFARTQVLPARPAELAPRLKGNFEEAFDQSWMRVQRRLTHADVHLDAAEEEGEIQIRHQSLQSMVVTSWSSGEGSSTVVTGLAARAAASNVGDVCIVDAGFHNRRLTFLAGMEGRPGLQELLEAPDLLGKIAVPIPRANLWFLPAGRSDSKDIAVVENQMQATISALEARFRYVLFDTPCLKHGVHAYRWGRNVVNAVLVVRAAHARRQTLIHAMTSLRLQGIKVLGTILNRRVDTIPGWLYPYL